MLRSILMSCVARLLAARSARESTQCVIRTGRSFTSTHSSRRRRRSAKFDLLVPSLRVFQEHHGHLLVPYNYPLPSPSDNSNDNDNNHDNKNRSDTAAHSMSAIPWPEETHGVNLGRRLHSFLTNHAHQRANPGIVTELQALGLPVGGDWKQYLWDTQTLAALRTYRAIHCHTIVPITFTVPLLPTRDAGTACGGGSDSLGDSTKAWPKETWGLELGRRVARLRESAHEMNDAQLKDLEALGFAFDVDATHWKQVILPALQCFHRIHGHATVHREYMVPSEDPQWPPSTWALRLGLVVHNMRCHGAYATQIADYASTLQSLGLVNLIDSPEKRWQQIILPALRVFHQERFASNQVPAQVPAQFIVPTALPWPRAAWGFRLGQLMHSYQAAGGYQEQATRDGHILQPLGVIWPSMDSTWTHKILPALKTYATLFRRPDQSIERIPVRFVVPQHAPWPHACWGLPLGAVVSRMRNRNQFAKQRARDSESLTRLGLNKLIDAAAPGRQ